MQSKADTNAALALALLDWNRKHLTHAGDLSEAVIGERFAPAFTVKANGRVHPTDRAGYKAFLDGFRRSVDTIDYQVHEVVADEASVVLAMAARVARVDGSVDRFEAMLLLRFCEAGLVTLWQEVYVRAEATA